MPGRLVTLDHRESMSNDPLHLAIRPPTDESANQQAIREEKERAARSISESIDEALRQERALERKKRPVKLLLLGQSESGKSTTLRQFQRLYTPTAFREERTLWRSVIQLNLARSVRIILNALTIVQTQQARQLAIEESRAQDEYDEYYGSDSNAFASGSSPPDHGPSSRPAPSVVQSQYDPLDDYNYIHISAELEMLKLRLEPVRHVETMLISKLAPPNEDEATRLRLITSIAPPHSHALSRSASDNSLPTLHSFSNGRAPSDYAPFIPSRGTGPDQELFIRSGYSWKSHMTHLLGRPTTGANSRPQSAEAVCSGSRVDYVTELLYASREDLVDLWHDPAVKEVLRRRKIRLDESPGFFLDSIERITDLDYEPSDDDVLRARLKTVGVSEYKLEMEVAAGRESGLEWRIFDVGGTRSQRVFHGITDYAYGLPPATWVPFFDDVNAIIFLAPISGFDQTLVEDRSANRLEDSVFLWKAICSNKLLAKVELVLFLNKCDILSQKLRSGIRLSKYVRSYGDRPNDVETASQYFKSKFAAIQREYSPQPRRFYSYCTSVTDTTTTSGILASVRDMVVREHLKASRLI